MSHILYSVDGGVTYQNAPSGIVVHVSTERGENLNIITTFTNEGIVQDVMNDEGEIIDTSCETYVEIEEELFR